jgi:hypothetical protein
MSALRPGIDSVWVPDAVHEAVRDLVRARGGGARLSQQASPVSFFSAPSRVRQTEFLLPPSVDEWVPERHLAHFRGGRGRAAGSEDGQPISWLGFGVVSSKPALGAAGLWLRHRVLSSRKIEASAPPARNSLTCLPSRALTMSLFPKSHRCVLSWRAE